MEIIIVILFFSISSAVCIQLFTKAHLLSESSVNLDQATMHAQSVAELFWGCSGDIEAMSIYDNLDSIIISNDENIDVHRMLILFDKDWNIIDTPTNDDARETACYMIIADIEKKKALAVYADTEYASNISEDKLAYDCTINVTDIRKVHEIPADTKAITGSIIYTLKTDYYLGGL
ncbi:MAG: hypothetical protein K6A23_06430 [Butyrivibrio sp.]|nr:hypothetical protein [Butyrivibrio sp.]